MLKVLVEYKPQRQTEKSKMNLRQLRYFLAVAEELHFGRAAAKLNMAQPPLSMQIKQLEIFLGVPLFERTKRRVNLTRAGETLQIEAQQILAQLEIATQKTQQAGRGERGQLAIAFVSSAMYSILPPWLKAFRQKYPEVSLTFQEATGLEQVNALRAHQLDIGFVRPPIAHSDITSRTVWQESLILALPQDHPLNSQSAISIAALKDEPFILIKRSLATTMYDKIIGFCGQAGFSPQISQTAEQLQTILGLIAANAGISILPAAAQKLRREGVCYRAFAEETPVIDLMMIWRKGEDCPLRENFLAARPV